MASLIFEKVRNHIVSRALDREGEGISTSGTDLNNTTNLTKVNEKLTVTEQDSSVPSSSEPSARPVATPTMSASSTTSRLTALERAFNHEVLYIIGKEQMKVKPNTNLFRKMMLRAFLFIRENTRTKIASLDVARDRVIEVGFVKDV